MADDEFELDMGIPGFTPTGWEPLIETVPDDFPFGMQRMTEEIYGVTQESTKLKKQITSSLRAEFSQRVEKKDLENVDQVVAATPWVEENSEAQQLLDKLAERQRVWLRKVEIYEERFQTLKREIHVRTVVNYPLRSEFTELPSFILYVKDHIGWLEHTMLQVTKSLKMGQMLRDPDLAALMEVTPTISWSAWKPKDKQGQEKELKIESATLVPTQTKEILAEQEEVVQKRVEARHKKRREEYRLARALRREQCPDRPPTPPLPPPPPRKDPPPYEGWEDLPPTGNVFDESIWPDLTVREHMAYWVKYPDNVIIFTQGAGTPFLERLRKFFTLLRHDVAEVMPTSTGLHYLKFKVEPLAKDFLSNLYRDHLYKKEEPPRRPPRRRPRGYYRDFEDMEPYDDFPRRDMEMYDDFPRRDMDLYDDFPRREMELYNDFPRRDMERYDGLPRRAMERYDGFPRRAERMPRRKL